MLAHAGHVEPPSLSFLVPGSHLPACRPWSHLSTLHPQDPARLPLPPTWAKVEGSKRPRPYSSPSPHQNLGLNRAFGGTLLVVGSLTLRTSTGPQRTWPSPPQGLPHPPNLLNWGGMAYPPTPAAPWKGHAAESQLSK